MKTILYFNPFQTNMKLYSSVIALLVLIACTSCEKEEIDATVLGEYVGSLHYKSYDYSSRTLTEDTTFTNARILVQKGENNKGGRRTLEISVFPSSTSSKRAFGIHVLLSKNTSLQDYYTDHGPGTTTRREGSFVNDSLNFKHQYLRGSHQLLTEAVIKAVRAKRDE